MTREEAIEYLQKLYMKAEITDEYGDMDDTEPYEMAVDMAIEALQEQQWIPCEERLPEMGQKVLASGLQTVFSHIYKGYEDDIHKWVWRDYQKTITAWQPIPEPYKEFLE